MIPQWLHWLSIASLSIAAVCWLVIVLDESRDPQRMWIMNIVWPATALFGGVLSLWAYFAVGKLNTRRAERRAEGAGQDAPGGQSPFWVKVGKGTAHCGGGCTIGDILAEWIIVFAPSIALWFGYRSIFQEKMFAVWIADYILAFGFGVAFQYFTIKPMREFSVRKGIIQALKADVASLTAWQIGMYGFMAVAHFWIFRGVLGAELEVPSPEFWFMMQIAMLFGFATSYPVNWMLIRIGVKEAM